MGVPHELVERLKASSEAPWTMVTFTVENGQVENTSTDMAGLVVDHDARARCPTEKNGT